MALIHLVFLGPVGAKNTSFPLLLVGNTLDAATALAGYVNPITI
jgi:hypothetical protein